MRSLIVCGAFLVLSSCATTPDLARVPNAFQLKTCDEGMRLMASGWVRSSVPTEAHDMLKSVRFKVHPLGLVWYKNGTSTIGACAYTRDKYGCAYSGHEFERKASSWLHVATWSQDRICVVG